MLTFSFTLTLISQSGKPTVRIQKFFWFISLTNILKSFSVDTQRKILFFEWIYIEITCKIILYEIGTFERYFCEKK